MTENYQKLIAKLNPQFTKLDEPLKNHTYVKIGGPADIWYEPQNTEELKNAVIAARELDIPITMVGMGSNILVGDKGIRGLVIKNNAKHIKIGDEVPIEENDKLENEVEARWQSDSAKGTFKYEFKDLDYDESDKPRILVTMESGVLMPFAMNFLIEKGITGLQWYAKIPGNLGGWIYNNIHGGTHFINEVLENVTVLDEQNQVKTLDKSELGVGYDKSRFHDTGEIILEATLKLFLGDKERARYTAIEWAKRKAIQPNNSLGSVFKNISNEEKERLGYPTTGIGYIVEHILKMSGYGVGDAVISDKHHNFIENKGNATAKDYLAVIQEIQKRAEELIGIKLEPEIFYIGEF